MSYAKVTSENAAPYSKQPKPDPALLQTEQPTAPNVADDALKVNVVSPEWMDDKKTVTSEFRPIITPDEEDDSAAYSYSPVSSRAPSSNKESSRKEKGKQALHADAENIKKRAMQDADYLKRKASEAKAFASKEIDKAENEGFWLYGRMKEQILRPGVAGGLLGAVNVTVLGTLGYLMYAHWDSRNRWIYDRKLVSSVVVGLGALSFGEGWIAEKWKQTRSGHN